MAKKSVLFWIVGVVFAITPLFADDTINLCGQDMYVREGFDPAWTHELPASGNDWTKFDAAPDGRTLRVSEMNILGMPHHSFFSFTENFPRTFTFVTSFRLTPDMVEKTPHVGLFLSHIGVNWSVYINGKLVKKEEYLDKDGNILVYRSAKFVLIPIDVRLLHEGENIVAFKIIGDPALKFTGFDIKKDFLIGDYTVLNRHLERINRNMFIFFYLIVGLFSLYMYSRKRAKNYYLFYGLMTVLMAVYIFSRAPLSYQWIDDTRKILFIELMSLFLIIPCIGAMFDFFIASRISLLSKIYSAFCVLCCFGIIISPVMVEFDILLIWQATTIIPVLYYPYMIITKGVIIDYRGLNETVVHPNRFLRKLLVYRNTFLGTFSGILIIGIFMIAACMIIDILDAIFFSKGLLWSQYGVFGFTVSVGLIIAAKYTQVHDSLGRLNARLEEKIERINEVNNKLTLSEEKNRFFIEYSIDYIFTLNQDGTFINANNTLMKELRIKESDLPACSAFNYIFFEEDEKVVGMELIQSNFDEMLATKTSMQFYAKLKAPVVSAEPKDFSIFLKYAYINDSVHILGKAVSITEDTLLSFFESEKQKYIINNYLISAEQMSRRIIRNSMKYILPHQVDMLRIVIREMIINSIEHGNLNITYAEKTAALENDTYFELIKKRQEDPLYRFRRVSIEYVVNEEHIVCKLTDDGDGFDHEKVMKDGCSAANKQGLDHGRGLSMAHKVFDEIRFNKKGNQILLIKHLSAEKSSVGMSVE